MRASSTREEIIQRLWGPDVFVDTRQGINTAVRKIRLALKDDPDNPRILQTIFGKGYRLMAPVTIGEGGTAQASAPPILGEGAERTATRPIPEPGTVPADRKEVLSAESDGIAAETSNLSTKDRSPIDPKFARVLFLVIQAGYLVLYGAAFVLFPNITRLGLPSLVPRLILLAGLIGAAVRLYLIAAVGFNYPGSGHLFRQAFPGILVLDALWAAAPLLLFAQLGYLALLFVAALVFLPFSQRTLMASAYGLGMQASSSAARTTG